MVPRTSNHVYKGWQGVAVCWLNDVGVSDDRLIVNTPGNPKAVGESLEALHAVLATLTSTRAEKDLFPPGLEDPRPQVAAGFARNPR